MPSGTPACTKPMKSGTAEQEQNGVTMPSSAAMTLPTPGVGNVMAAMLGIVTPFCSCSAVPLFIGFVQAGVPLGITFSFLISHPMVNEVALTLLLGLFGIRVAALTGAGPRDRHAHRGVIGRVRMEAYLEGWVGSRCRGRRRGRRSATRSHSPSVSTPASRRCARCIGRVWPYVIAGIAIGAYPPDTPPRRSWRASWGATPGGRCRSRRCASRCTPTPPASSRSSKRCSALGTVLAFMMSVMALWLPEMIILRKVLKPRLIATFIGVVASGILLVGYVFNAALRAPARSWCRS